MFTTLIVQPIFNLLVLIYNLIPGHNFGLAIILFTIIVRLLMWPLVKKQLHQTKLIRKLQPEVKRIKAAAKGDKQKEALMMMELYKERGIRPLRSIGLILLQMPILFGLYLGLQRVLKDPHELVNFSYPFIQNFAWMQELAKDISKFDETLLGVIDLTMRPIGPEGVYIPGLLLVIGSAAIQYYQSKMIMPQDKDARSLRQIIKDAGEGKQADQSEMSAAVGRSTLFMMPAIIFIVSVGLPAALSLYWLVGGIVAVIQQSIALRDDAEEMDKLADEPSHKRLARSNKSEAKTEGKAEVEEDKSHKKSQMRRGVADTSAYRKVVEGEVIPAPPKPGKKRKQKGGKGKKRRR